MSISDSSLSAALRESSDALQSVLRAILEVERHYAPPLSPLEFLREITTSSEWAWLQPLYGLIADIDHALAGKDETLPASEVAAIGAHARTLLSGPAVGGERAFLERYRSLLQHDTSIAIAHAQALQALRDLPPEATSEAERLHAHHQWNERRAHWRAGKKRV